jgi:ABC-type microcin C transport system permease subunit YejB
MSTRVIIGTSAGWLLAVILYVLFVDGSFSIWWPASGPLKRSTIIAAAYALTFLHTGFLVGWVLPLGFGIYRLTRHQ